MAHCAALDVSDKETAIHVLDGQGQLVWKGKRPSEPEALAAALRRHAPALRRAGLETGQRAPRLHHSLKELGLPVVCLDARAATALQRNKTDARDAETLAQLMRTGWCREARVKGWAAHLVRHLVAARARLVGISIDLSNQIRSLLKVYGPGMWCDGSSLNRSGSLDQTWQTNSQGVRPFSVLSRRAWL
jgi:transposase